MPPRKTHNFPNGVPIPIALVYLALGALVIWAVVLSDTSTGWNWATFVAVLVAIVVVDSRLLSHYEKTGRAVRIQYPPAQDVRFMGRTPAGMRVLYGMFFATVAAFLVFGFAPLPDAAAKYGIVGCIFVLFGLAVAKMVLERRYVKIGRAVEVISRPG